MANSEPNNNLTKYSSVNPLGFNADGIMTFLTKGSPNDVKIVLCDGEIEANEGLLCFRSKYFSKVFGADMDKSQDGKESQGMKESQSKMVTMDYCSKDVMWKVLRSLFGGETNLTKISLMPLLEMMKVTSIMLLEDLSTEVEDYTNLALEDVRNEKGEFFQDGFATFSECLQGLKFIHDKPENLIVSVRASLIKRIYQLLENTEANKEDFQMLPIMLIKEVLLFDDDKVEKKADKVRLDSFAIWYAKNEESCSDEDKKEIRASIDFNKFSIEELLTYVEESKLYTTKEIKQRVIQINKEKDESLKEKDDTILAKENLLEMITITTDEIIREKEEAIRKGVEDMQRITVSLKKMM